MDHVTFKSFVANDAHWWPRMRLADANEIMASHGLLPLPAILSGAAQSVRVESILVDGRSEGVWGVAPADGAAGVASPWMLATPRIPERAMVLHGRRIIAELAALYLELFNYVDVRNRRSRRWLAALGFAESPSAPYGVAQCLFVRMTKRSGHV